MSQSGEGKGESEEGEHGSQNPDAVCPKYQKYGQAEAMGKKYEWQGDSASGVEDLPSIPFPWITGLDARFVVMTCITLATLWVPMCMSSWAAIINMSSEYHTSQSKDDWQVVVGMLEPMQLMKLFQFLGGIQLDQGVRAIHW